MTNARKVDNTKTPTVKDPKSVKRPPSKIVRVKSSRLGFRASESQAKVIRMASDISHKSLTEFITDSAYQAAEKIILDQRLFMVSGNIFNQFTEILDRPEQDNEGLKDLFSSLSPSDLDEVKKT